MLDSVIAALASILVEAAQLARDVAARRELRAARDMAEQPGQPSAESRHDGAT
jgi:hypothetical protein